jgi:hypothetical protein
VLKDYVIDFTKAHLAALQHVFDYPWTDGRTGRSADGKLAGKASAIYDQIGGYHHRKTKTRRAGLCSIVGPEYLLDEQLLTWERLRRLGVPDVEHMGKALSIDGTDLRVARENARAVSDRHERLLQDGLECSFGYHGPDKAWRGLNGLSLRDVAGGVNLWGRLVPAGDAEHLQLVPMLTDMYDRAAELGLTLNFEYLVGDKGFAQRRVAEDLYYLFGIALVVPWKHGSGKGCDWADNKGVPQCSCEGSPSNMRFESLKEWVGPAKRRKLGLRPGENLRDRILADTKLRHPRIVWRCQSCRTPVETYFHHSPLAHSPLPYKDVHGGRTREQRRYRVRQDLMAARNGSESYNATQKDGGEHPGPAKARWINHIDQARWVYHGRCLTHALQRLVALDGSYRKVLADMEQRGLLDPAQAHQFPLGGLGASAPSAALPTDDVAGDAA